LPSKPSFGLCGTSSIPFHHIVSLHTNLPGRRDGSRVTSLPDDSSTNRSDVLESIYCTVDRTQNDSLPTISNILCAKSAIPIARQRHNHSMSKSNLCKVIFFVKSFMHIIMLIYKNMCLLSGINI
ncbi:hypothetical protein ALC57_08664, partial [Trachymyrmex cornetzi]